MQRANRQEVPPPDYSQDDSQDYPSAVHPLQRYAAAHAAPSRTITRRRNMPTPIEPDPSRYDDALYGQLDPARRTQHDPAYADDPYAYQDGYDDGAEEPVQKRRGGMVTVSSFLRWRWSEPARRLPIAPMSDRPAAASRRSSGPTPVRPRSCRRRRTAPPRCRTAWRRAMAPRRSFRAKKRRSTSTPGPGRAWCFRR